MIIKSAFKVFSPAVLLAIAITQAYAVTRFVTPSGAGLLNGTSWANAFPVASLQTAINISAPGDEVWVASGTYLTTNSSNRNISFSMRNDVTIYGSFNGTETLLSQRILTCGPSSILSGETGAPGITDNSYHVISNVSLNTTAVIDGFVIRGANDNRAVSFINGLGGGIYNNGGNAGGLCSPTIRNCVITGNQAVFGAGIFNSGHTGGNSNPIISNCIIAYNLAYDGGGGIDNFGLGGNASPTITNCIIYSNIANTAGGMYCWGGNVNGNSNPVILNCAFINNRALTGNAGGIIADNLNFSGGGNSGTSNPVVRNSLFRGNTAAGGGPQFYILGTATLTGTYSNIDLTNQNFPHIISGPGTGNINSNPLFISDSNAAGADSCWMTADDGLNLQSGSGSIDGGNNTGVPLTDILFNPRIINSTVDMGPYEYSPPPTFELDLTVNLEACLQTDTINVELRGSVSPYTLVENIVSTGGLGIPTIVNYTNAVNGVNYYIVIKHRNSVETWSKPGGEVFTAENLTYDFTTAASQAFGNNQVLSGSEYSVYTGDVTQDGNVDLSDIVEISNDASSFVTGYVVTDLNCNNIVDLTDLLFAYNNSSLFVSIKRP